MDYWNSQYPSPKSMIVHAFSYLMWSKVSIYHHYIQCHSMHLSINLKSLILIWVLVYRSFCVTLVMSYFISGSSISSLSIAFKGIADNGFYSTEF
jgi:hypothetical protein